MAFHKLANPIGEVATAKAARASDLTAFVLSCWGTTSLEEVHQAYPDGLKMI
jgi:isopentenyl diphosphate isomerase/L-lactate dehydrogenase-like FMN-dependent dehydrogenase